MTFLDAWRTFNTCFDEGGCSALTQLVGYKLLAIDDELKHPDSFLLTDRELMSRTGIKSGQTIVEARRQLKNAGLIDFKASKARPTRYSIKQKSSKITHSIKQDSSKIQSTGLVPYTQIRDAHGLYGASEAEQKERQESFPQTPFKEGKEKNKKIKKRASACESQEKVDELIELWEQSGGTKLTQLLIAKLHRLVQTHMYEDIKKALEKANESKTLDTFNFTFFLKKLAEIENVQTEKGDESGDRNEYTPQTYDGTEAWNQP